MNHVCHDYIKQHLVRVRVRQLSGNSGIDVISPNVAVSLLRLLLNVSVFDWLQLPMKKLSFGASRSASVSVAV